MAQPVPVKNRARSSPMSGEQKFMLVLLIFVPLTLIGARANASPSLQFFLAVAAVVPLAAFIGSATEALADRLGGKVGGLLNATFGNSPDFLVGVFGVQKGLIPLVKATLIGALISNSALIMGACYLVAGLKYGRTRFRRDEAGHHSVLMMLTVAAVLFPSIGTITLCGSTRCTSSRLNATVLHVSVGISLILLVAYTAYVMYGIFGWERLQRPKKEGRDAVVITERASQEPQAAWPLWLSISVLAAATFALIPITDILTGSVGPVTSVLGWSQVFVGMVIVANAGNVAEAYAALKFAFQRPPTEVVDQDSGLDLALGIASASSIQIATFVAPIIVLYSLTGHQMTLVFSPVEIAILLLLVIIFTYIAQDGESNWLEGAQLIALYGMAGIMFYAFPISAFGG